MYFERYSGTLYSTVRTLYKSPGQVAREPFASAPRTLPTRFMKRLSLGKETIHFGSTGAQLSIGLIVTCPC